VFEGAKELVGTIGRSGAIEGEGKGIEGTGRGVVQMQGGTQGEWHTSNETLHTVGLASRLHELGAANETRIE